MNGHDGPYNYARFRTEHYFDGTRRPSVRAGDPAPTLAIETLDGTEHPLPEFWHDGPAVFEFGSITCPIFQANVEAMNRVAASYPDVAFYVVYVREAHPGPDCGPHESMAEKRSLAGDVDAAVSDRTLLVDDLAGSVHRAFDAMPNSVHVVGRDGIVSYRADWLQPDALESALEVLLDEDGIGAAVDHRDETDNFHTPTLSILAGARRAFGRAGWRSALDFVRELPRLVHHRLRSDGFP